MKKKRLLLFIIFFGSSLFSWAQADIKNYESFKSIPILDEGRLKPLDTYARNVLLQFSGRDTYEGRSAIAWLTHLLFAPSTTQQDKVFLINNPDIATALNIPVDAHRRYTPAQLRKSYKKLAQLEEAAKNIPEKERSIVENEIIRVFGNINLYADLSRCLLFAYPHPDFTITSQANKLKLGLPSEQNQFSFIDIALKADKLSDITMGLENKSASGLSMDETEMMKVIQNLFQWSNTYKDLPLAVIPSSKGWVSPWDAMSSDFKYEQIRGLIILWRNMAMSYAQGQEIDFNMATHIYLSTIQNNLNKDELKIIHKFPLELAYYASRPFVWARLFYILAFIFFVISFSSTKPLWYRGGLFSVIVGFIPHVLGLMARIIIMGRPPVSNLYETFIFVGFIAVLLGLAIEYFNRQWLGIVTAAISGTVLLFIAGKYSAEGDTLKMLVAVLNSNFWLATHVTTITMGYAATCVAGLLGHIWLLQAAIGKNNVVLEKTYKTTLGVLGLALPLTFLGTNLGGIWADQSWGRFWGWDPKENGALMIVIWTTMVLHARVSQLMGARGVAIGSVLGMVVVMWAWFGVNLLSVGLHSYGFTAGVASTLAIYVVGEVIFLGITTFVIGRQRYS